jgi:hypothetical protein
MIPVAAVFTVDDSESRLSAGLCHYPPWTSLGTSAGSIPHSALAI